LAIFWQPALPHMDSCLPVCFAEFGSTMLKTWASVVLGEAFGRSVTPEVAGSSPVAPVKYLQIGIFSRRLDRRPFAHPAHIPHANRPGIPAESRSQPVIPARRTAGPPRRRSVGRRSRSGAFAGVSSLQATAPRSIPHGSRVARSRAVDRARQLPLSPIRPPASAAIPSLRQEVSMPYESFRFPAACFRAAFAAIPSLLEGRSVRRREICLHLQICLAGERSTPHPPDLLLRQSIPREAPRPSIH